MADSNQIPADNHVDIFNFDSDETIEHHGRKSVRYIRKDIRVVLIVSNLLGIDRRLKATLQDISSKGIRVSTEEKLSLNKRLTVALKFKDGTKFIIKAKIVRISADDTHEYGIQFDQQQNTMADHLLETQTDLLFK